MPQEKFPAMLWRRTRELIEKFYSVKGAFTAFCTIGFFNGQIVPTWLFASAWIVFIGGRYVDKFLDVKNKLFKEP